MPQAAGRRRTFDWYLTVTLASITGLLFCFALAFDLVALGAGDNFLSGPSPTQVAPLLGAVAIITVISVIWFWIRMLNDYFRSRPEKHPVAWGWALFMLNFCGALAYFWFVWRPRNGPMRTPDP